MGVIELLGSAFFVVIITLAWFAWWAIRYLLVMLPKRQQDIVERFAPDVVDQVILEYGTSSKRQQRLVAIARLKTIFDEENIAQPSDSLIETAISSEIYKRQQKKNEEELWIKELKKDMLSQANTAEIPVTPQEDLWVL